MAGRRAEWVDVRLRGKVIGFYTGPTQDGKYAAFLDNEGAGSSVVGTYDTTAAATSAITAAHLRS